METFISSRGYSILKNDTNKKIIKEIKKELTVSPTSNPNSSFTNNKYCY